MNECRITALMPLKCYHPLLLKKSVESIIKQSCSYWHLIIIVEKNDFNKFKKLLQNELKIPRIEIIVNQGRKLAGAINTGIRHAKTDFVAILLADDMWAPEAVLVLNNYIAEHPTVDLFHSSRRFIDENDTPISSIYHSKDNFSINDFKIESPAKHLLCWRREKALAVGGLDESLNSVGPDDYDFPWTMAQEGAIFKAVKECLYYYRDHRECYRLTTHLPLSTHKKELTRIFRKHGADTLAIKEKIAAAEKDYLPQCLFRSKFDKFIKKIIGYDARNGWREKYR